jgi:hypothetical protein
VQEDQHHDHLLKAVADATAGQLSSGDGAASDLLLERLGPLMAPARKTAAAAPGTVGVWEAGPQGHHRSDARRDDWHFWADVQSIPPKGDRKRVVLLGESVARGFLYDPEFNPALALQACLPVALGQPVEVVDLAKTDLLPPELMTLLDAATTLDPDVLVVFVGNNWFMQDKRDHAIEAAVLRERGVVGLKQLREQRLAAFAGGALRQQLAGLSQRQPVVVVVPEINLADWRLDAEPDAPWLPGGRNRRWLECRTAARAALADGRCDEAAVLAREMVDLDGGTAASGWTLLADCARAAGDTAAARACLEKARDSHIWDYTHQTPRILSVAQSALRDCAQPGRIAVVDLPHCFAAWRPSELPGRRLFLDYCHMSAEGIRVAMAATALQVTALLDASRPLPELASLVEATPTPTARVEAAAHFGGALHSAHWGQGNPFVSVLCHEAARRSPQIAQAMRLYLELQTLQAPAWACAAAEKLAAVVPPFLCAYILQTPTKMLDLLLLEAIAGALEQNGMPSRAFLAELRRQERSLSNRPRNLLDPYHRASWADLDWLEWPNYFRHAYGPRSRYPWVSRTPRAVAFVLTCRCRHATGASECRLWINGTCAGRLSLTPGWSTYRFSAPAHLVQAGVNCLEIDWPVELPDGELVIGSIARELELRRYIPMLPVFAEVFSLTAVEC